MWLARLYKIPDGQPALCPFGRARLDKKRKQSCNGRRIVPLLCWKLGVEMRRGIVVNEPVTVAIATALLGGVGAV